MSQIADRKSSLSREAVIALGNVSPELAWLQTRDMVTGAMLDSPNAAKELVTRAHLPYNSPESMTADLEAFPAVRAINLLVESNPEISLRNIPQLPPLEPLKAVLNMLTHNEAFS